MKPCVILTVEYIKFCIRIYIQFVLITVEYKFVNLINHKIIDKTLLDSVY